jgi:lipoyl(octanoyl) transferase
MAVDEALMESVRAGGPPVLRVYRWSPACISLGRNQPARGEYREELLERDGVQVVRRLTGGRAVLHDSELTYSVVAGERMLGSPRTAYSAINRALVTALRHLGVEAGLQPRTSTRAAVPSLAPCFRDPAEGEVVVRGRKLVGSAQFRERGVILQHGSILFEGDQRRVAGYLRVTGPGDVAPLVLSDILPAIPEWKRIVAALAQAFTEALGVQPAESTLTATENARTAELSRRYADPGWVWRL